MLGYLMHIIAYLWELG